MAIPRYSKDINGLMKLANMTSKDAIIQFDTNNLNVAITTIKFDRDSYQKYRSYLKSQDYGAYVNYYLGFFTFKGKEGPHYFCWRPDSLQVSNEDWNKGHGNPFESSTISELKSGCYENLILN